MALVDIDDKLKDEVQAIVQENKIDFPSMKNFVDRAIRAELRRIRKGA